MLVRIAFALACITAAAGTAGADENEAVRFAIFRGYTEAIEAACPTYFVYDRATSGSHLSPQDRLEAMASAPSWRKEMAQYVRSLGCDRAARDAMTFTDLSFTQVWEHKE